MALDHSKLLNVKKLANGEFQARCPACAEAGADTKGEHLKIYADGKFSCAANQGDKEHRKEIFKLAGIPMSGRSRSGLVSVNAFKAEESKVVTDLAAFPRFSRRPRTKA